MRYKTVRPLASFLRLIRFWVNVSPPPRATGHPPLGCSTKNVKAWRPALVLASLSQSGQVKVKEVHQTYKGLLKPQCYVREVRHKFLHLIWPIILLPVGQWPKDEVTARIQQLVGPHRT